MENSNETLLERTGNSVSGIGDIIHNKPNKTKQLLYEIDERFNTLKLEIEDLERQLKQAKCELRLMVGNFSHVHEKMKLGDKPLVFEKEGAIVIVRFPDGNGFEYECLELTKINPNGIYNY